MKIPILCLTLNVLSVYADRSNSAISGFNLPLLNLPSLGINIPTLPSAAPIVPPRPFGYPKKVLPFMPVPIVKKVTHHHIHHVIAHKGVVKSKYSEGNNGFDLDNKDNDNSNTNQLNYKTYKEEFGLNGDLNDNGFKSGFNKRGGGQLLGGSNSAQHLGDLLASSSGQNKRGIRGYIGGQKAEFVPLIIGIVDDASDLISGLDSGREFSKRKGSLRPESKGREYVPSKETIKLFEDLAKMGYK